MISVRAKPLTCWVEKRNSTPAVSIVRMLASRIVRKPRAKPELTAERTVLPLRTSSLMRSNTTTLASAAMPMVEDRAGDAGQRERHRDRAVQAPHVDAVDDERDVGDEAEEAVEDEHEDEHQAEAGEAGDERRAQRVLAERGRDLLLVRGLEGDGQGAGVEHEGQVLGLLDGEVAGDLGPAALDPVREVGVGVVDAGVGRHRVVEHDREGLGDAAEEPLVVELLR